MTLDADIYRRYLPHIQSVSGSYFITFCTRDKWVLPEAVRNIVLDCCKYVHEHTAFVHCAVVMPDHVHLVLTPYGLDAGQPALLREILRGLKGTSSRKINAALGRRGAVWQPESFDHRLRKLESAEEKVDYILQNPVRRQLCKSVEDYPWTWRASEQDNVARVNDAR